MEGSSGGHRDLGRFCEASTRAFLSCSRWVERTSAETARRFGIQRCALATSTLPKECGSPTYWERPAWRAVLSLAGLLLAIALPAVTGAQETLVTFRTVAERRTAELPGGALAWRVESFPSRVEAEADAGPTGLVAETGGTVYLVTLLGTGAAPARGRVLAEVSSLTRPTASGYVLAISEMRGPAGSRSVVHSHPGVESYYVITGEMQLRSPSGLTTVRSGEGSPGLPGGTPNEVISAGAVDLLALVLFAVDAAQPITSAASLPGGGPVAVSAPLLVVFVVLAIAGVGLIVLLGARLGRRGV